MIRLLLFLVGTGFAAATSAQLDTIRMVSLGGAGDEGATSVLSLGTDALVTGFTDSNADGLQAPWLVRMDSMLQVVWQRVLPIQGTAVGGVLEEGGKVVVASRELLPAAAGYGVHWHRVDPQSGEVLNHAAFEASDWVIPHKMDQTHDTLLTWVTDYRSGTAQPMVIGSRWVGNNHEVLFEHPFGTPGLTEYLVDGLVASGYLWLASTEKPTADSARGRIRRADFEGNVVWTDVPEYEGAHVEACALTVRDSLIYVGLTGNDGSATPTAHVARYLSSGDGEPLLWTLSNPAQVRAIRWNPPELNVLYRTEVFGLGAGDALFSRYQHNGSYIDGRSFGWEEREEPEAMMEDVLGAIWLVGTTEHVNPNMHVVRASNDQIGEHHLDAFETELMGPLSIPTLPEDGSARLAPNPGNGPLRVLGVPCNDFSYAVFTLHGTVIGSGRGQSLDASRWPRGLYLIDVACDTWQQSFRFFRW